MSTPRAHSVRIALPAEATAIADIQKHVLAYDPATAELAQRLDLIDITRAWQEAITTPPLASYRVLVATDGLTGQVVGFAVTGPSDDEDAEPTTGLIAELVVSPSERGKGHGSRLLHACIDTLAADGFTLATWWLVSTDDERRALAVSTGWEADGAHRELGSEESPHLSVRQVRLHTAIG